jgi:hypothetical protein
MANYTYPNVLIENKYKTILETELNLNQFCTIAPMAEGAGDTKRIVYRSVSGQVDEVAMGQGNTHDIEVSGYFDDYVLKTTQGHGFYYDEEAQKDGMIVDAMLKGMAETMLNKWNRDIMAQFDKAVYNEVAGNISFAGFVDAIAKFGEQDKALFALINPASLATLRKALADDLKYTGDFARTGYIGSVCSVPIYMSNIVEAGEVIIASKEAVTLFINKQNEVEAQRDPDTRKNEYWIRTVAVAGLTNDHKVCRLAAAATTATTITTSAAGAAVVAGAATTGAKVDVYVNGELAKSGVAESSAYSITLDKNLVAGDVIKVVARKAGQISSAATATAA